MSETKKFSGCSLGLIAGLCVIVLIPAAAIRVDQYLLRRNAEHLLADLKSLEMRKSTYHDARQVIDRWKTIYQEGSCERNRCDVEIGVVDFLDHRWEFFEHHQKLMQVLRILGGRPAQFEGYIRVRRDLVWGTGIRAIVLSYSTRYQDINLTGRVGSSPPSFVSPLHPEYDVG
ncbi:MAG TPA: hypothetical protein VNO32_12670, partial [Candidatus Acidoferrum sp.]|nr:hypothetical protein [Candidatus Acidoferrum sp.]